MHKSLLQRLYDGEVYPDEEIVPRTPEYRRIDRAISDEKHYFYDLLNDEGRKHFDRLDDLRYQSSSLFGYENFVYGFRLGVGLIMETFGDALEHNKE